MWRGGDGELPMNNAQRDRLNAAECLSPAERCGRAYRVFTVFIAQTWLALARHQDAMDFFNLLPICAACHSPRALVVQVLPRACDRTLRAGGWR